MWMNNRSKGFHQVIFSNTLCLGNCHSRTLVAGIHTKVTSGHITQPGKICFEKTGQLAIQLVDSRLKISGMTS